MIVLLSPAKTLDYTANAYEKYSEARLLQDSQKLVKALRKQSVPELQQLMSISEKLAEENFERYHKFSLPFNMENAKQAILAFKGDVYQGLNISDFSEADLDFAQDHIRILSGLYGVLRPLDLMQAYRLEMGTKMQQNGSKNLYEFWGSKITKLINEDVKQSASNWVVNLASVEYFKSVKKEALKADLLDVDFKENRAGKYKTIAFNAKKARGTMSRQIVKNRIIEIEHLKHLEVNGYLFNEEKSTEKYYLFTKE